MNFKAFVTALDNAANAAANAAREARAIVGEQTQSISRSRLQQLADALEEAARRIRNYSNWYASFLDYDPPQQNDPPEKEPGQ